MTPLKKGTKLTDNPRNVRLEIRLTQAENDMLKDCAEKQGTTKTNIIIQGIKMVSESLKK